MKNVEVASYDGLLAEFARRFERPVIVKGLRAGTDFENEFQMSQINKTINPELETMFLTSSVKYTFLSSSVCARAGQLRVGPLGIRTEGDCRRGAGKGPGR